MKRRILRIGLLLIASVAIVGGATMVYPYIYYWGAGRFWDKAEPEIHLLTAGYQGPVLIIFSDSSGAPPRYEGNARRYDIPLSGVLRTQFAPNKGWGRPDYEYVDAAGKRTRIVPGTPCDDSLPGDSVQACLMGRMFMNGRSPDYSAYVVSQQGNRRQVYERGDSLVRAVLFGHGR